MLTAPAAASSLPSTSPARPHTNPCSPASRRRKAGGLRLARQQPSVRAPPPSARATAARRLAGLRPLARHHARADVLPDVPGHADARPRRGHRPLLPHREGRRRSVHRRRRGGGDALRLAGRGRGRQRSHAPQRADWIKDGSLPPNSSRTGRRGGSASTRNCSPASSNRRWRGDVPTQDAPRILGVSRQTVLQRVKRGELYAVHVHHGKRTGLRIKVVDDQAALFEHSS